MRKDYNGTLLHEPENRPEFLYNMCKHIQKLIYSTDTFSNLTDEEVFAIDVATSHYEDELYMRLYGKN